MATADPCQSTMPVDSIYDRLRLHLTDDVHQRLEANLNPNGRGRPLKLPPLQPTNKFFLQLGLLKLDNNLAWESISTFTVQTLGLQFGEGLPHVSSIINRLQKEVADIPLESLPEFLSAERDFQYLKGAFCQRLGINVNMLLNDSPSLEATFDKIPNGLVIDLEHFRVHYKYSQACMHSWLLKLCPQLEDFHFSVKQLRSRIDTLLKQYNRRRKDGGSCLSNLVDADFSEHINQQKRKPADQPEASSSSATPCVECPVLENKIQHTEDINKKLQCKIKELEEQLQLKNTQESALRESIMSGKLEIQALKDSVISSDSSLTAVLTEKTSVLQKLTEKTKLCSALARNANNVRRKAERVANLQQQAQSLNTTVTELTEKVQGLQKNCANLQSRLTKARGREAGLRETIRTLRADIDRLTAEMSAETQQLELKTPQGHYTPQVQTCVLELLGHEIAANRIASVIACVLSQLLKLNIDSSDLPSKTTVLRFADTGHALSKMQILEEIKSQLYDLHMDGTTRNGRKIVGHQITLQNGKQLSIGFSAVDRENTDTLIDLTMTIMNEISSLGSTTDDETDTALKDIFRHMVSTMTDRAAVMKSVGKKLSELKEDMLQDGTGLEFLFCNAHFLLGLSAATERALNTFEVREQWKKNLGRDLLPAFYRFKNSASEPAAIRLIRTACDVLGPRGDEKNGCQDDWLTYLSLPHVQRRNEIGSFKGNRFNNLFESAAGIIYHRHDIATFFSEYKGTTTPNLKQRSVLEDIKSDNIMMMVCAIAVVYVCVAGPFWVLVNSSIHYLDMHKHIQKMTAHLESISDDRDALHHVLDTFPSLLETFFLEDNAVLVSVQAAARELRENEQLTSLLQELAGEFCTVTKRQLSDFLPGGRYGQAATDDQRQRMAHSKLTNLFGEANFGDLDYSQKKRQFCSLHHHSTVTMEKRNRTSTWFAEKQPDQQQQLLSTARKTGKALRKEHKEREKEENRKAVQRIQTKKDDFIAKRNEQLSKRIHLIRAIHNAGGPWITGEEGRHHLATLRTVAAKREALRLQIQFHRTVLHAKSPLLIMASKTTPELTASVCQFIDSLELTREDPRLPADQPLQCGPAINMDEDECDSFSAPLSPVTETEEEDIQISIPSGNCHSNQVIPSATTTAKQFSTQGEKLAVYYDDKFYIGEVLEVKDEQTATVTFMKGFGKRNAFTWPDSIDLDTISARFVYAWNLDMYTTNGRIWCVKDFDTVVEGYAAFRP